MTDPRVAVVAEAVLTFWRRMMFGRTVSGNPEDVRVRKGMAADLARTILAALDSVSTDPEPADTLVEWRVEWTDEAGEHHCEDLVEAASEKEARGLIEGDPQPGDRLLCRTVTRSPWRDA